MKKVKGYIDVAALGRYDFEFFVEDELTDEEIRKAAYDKMDFYFSYNVEEGYEPVQEIVYKKIK